MTDRFDPVREHYRPTGLPERLEAALAALGPPERRLTPPELAPLDQFHTRGLAATAELARLARIGAEDRVLDLGAGLGGPARFLAATHGCRVAGLDLSEPFVTAARALTARTGQSDGVSFEVGSALDIPGPAASYTVVLLQHVAMNIADRAGLYREIRRVLAPGGRFATYDVVLAEGAPQYPLPWAQTPATSCLLTAEATCAAVEAAGFRSLAVQDDSEAAKLWAADLRVPAVPPALSLGVVMGPGMAERAGNLARGFLDGRLGLLTAVFQPV